MKYLTYNPPASLKEFVRFFWTLECDFVEEKYVHRSLADGCVQLVFHYKTNFDEITANHILEPSFSSGISGQSQNFRRFVTKDSFGIFGAYLYPYAVPKLFSIPASEITNQMVNFVDFIGNEGKELEERIMLAANNDLRIQVLSAFLESKLMINDYTDLAISSCITRIIHSKEIENVTKLASLANLSTRQFERRFVDYAGFTPKFYSRLIRFQAAVKKFGGNFTSLTDVAHECGYYDQSHFIREFKEFSGYTPATFFNGKAEGIEWR